MTTGQPPIENAEPTISLNPVNLAKVSRRFEQPTSKILEQTTWGRTMVVTIVGGVLASIQDLLSEQRRA